MARKTNPNSGSAKDKGKSESPRDFRKVGPTSIEGVEAHDLPDNRGPVETIKGKEAQRTLPQESGTIGGEGGLRASLGVSDAKRHGHRKRN
jgi:hypothetical protein